MILCDLKVTTSKSKTDCPCNLKLYGLCIFSPLPLKFCKISKNVECHFNYAWATTTLLKGTYGVIYIGLSTST